MLQWYLKCRKGQSCVYTRASGKMSFCGGSIPVRWRRIAARIRYSGIFRSRVNEGVRVLIAGQGVRINCPSAWPAGRGRCVYRLRWKMARHRRHAWAAKQSVWPDRQRPAARDGREGHAVSVSDTARTRTTRRRLGQIERCSRASWDCTRKCL